MNKLRKYLLANFSSLFLSMFLPLFVIASMIFSIKLATYTAIIKLTLSDMLNLYLFVLPDILFYTLPISFFVAAVLALFKLSNDNEIVVIFSLGIKPTFLVKTLFVPASLLSILLLIDNTLLFPHTYNISKNFIDQKKSEAQFNLSASEFGNNFGDWLLYIGKEDKKHKKYEDIFLFNKKNEEEILVSAKQANVINDGGILQLELTNGEGYLYSKEKFTQINFGELTIFDQLRASYKEYQEPFDYWFSPERKNFKKRMFVSKTLIAFFPLLSLFLVAALGVVHARHQKSKVYLFTFLSIAIYYTASMSLHKPLGYHAIYIVGLTWLLVTYLLYKKTIAKRF